MKKMMMDYMQDVKEIATKNLATKDEWSKEFVDYLKDKKINKILMVASGSSANIGSNVLPFIQDTCKTDVEVVSPANFIYQKYKTVKEDTLVVLMSQGGGSTNTIAASQKALETCGLIIGFCNFTDSPMGKILKHCYSYHNIEGDLFVAKGFEVSTISLLVYFTELAMATKKIDSKRYEQLYKEFAKMIEVYDGMVKKSEDYYNNNKHFFKEMYRCYVVAGGATIGAATEGKLKLSETIGAAANEYEVEEFLHGPVYAVTKDTTMFFLDTKDSLEHERTIDVFNNIKMITDRRILITTDSTIKGDNVIYVGSEEIEEMLAGILLVAPIQYFSDRLCLDYRLSTFTQAVVKFGDIVGFKDKKWGLKY